MSSLFAHQVSFDATPVVMVLSIMRGRTATGDRRLCRCFRVLRLVLAAWLGENRQLAVGDLVARVRGPRLRRPAVRAPPLDARRPSSATCAARRRHFERHNKRAQRAAPRPRQPVAASLKRELANAKWERLGNNLFSAFDFASDLEECAFLFTQLETTGLFVGFPPSHPSPPFSLPFIPSFLPSFLPSFSLTSFFLFSYFFLSSSSLFSS